MTGASLLGGLGILCGVVLMTLGASGVGIGQWWGTGRLNRTKSVLMGAAFALFSLQVLIVVSDWAHMVLLAISLALILTVMMSWRASAR